MKAGPVAVIVADPDYNPPVIVAEVSVNWPKAEEDAPTISRRFEALIELNRTRGYTLSDWKFSQISTRPDTIVETIIAVFKLEKQGKLNLKTP